MNYYTDFEECRRIRRVNTNPRYSNFCQSHFTAGDEQQFEQHLERVLRPKPENPAECLPDFWEKYSALTTDSVEHTFQYIFHKFKKGMYIRIEQGKVEKVLPFSKHHYTNEWSDRVQVDLEVVRRAYAIEGRPFREKHVNKHVDQWYANNGLVRFEYPFQENDTGVGTLVDMLETLVEVYPDTPSLECFVNKRDHPLLRVDGLEPYDTMFGETPLCSHQYPTYAPILSMCGREGFADILIPTWDDWARVQMEEGKYFPKHTQFFRDRPFSFEREWENKKPVAVFRGSSTGMGVTLADNMRLKVAWMSLQGERDVDGLPFLDAGLTSWNARPRIDPHTKHLVTFSDKLVQQVPLVPYMDVESQSEFKYLLNIDGHVAAYRLSLMLGMGSVVLSVESPYRLWFSSQLIPYTHYVPVASDLSDLFEKIRWCKSHDTECRYIAQHAKAFYDTVLSKQGMLTYLYDLFVRLKRHTGQYVYLPNPYSLLRERGSPQYSFPPNDLPFQEGEGLLPPYGRTHALLEGLGWYFSCLPKEKWVFETDMSYNRNSTLKVWRYKQLQMLSKESNETRNEAVIGSHCINPLLADIPHFVYTYPSTEETVVHVEYIPDGVSFFDYLRGDQFQIHEYCSILVQTALAIHTAQHACLFMHYDLYPWNILIQRPPQKRTVHYTLDASHFIRLHATALPILIDYGKANGVVKGVFYGSSNPFAFCPIHDVLCILISSMYTILHSRTLNKKELRVLFTLSEFFSGGAYTQHKTFSTMKELKYFLHTHKKYSSMLETPKHDMADKTPLDFVHFIHKHGLTSFHFTSTREWPMRGVTSRHAMEYLMARNDTERKQTWERVLERLHHIVPLEEHDRFSLYEFERILSNLRDYTDLPTHSVLEYLSPLRYSLYPSFPIPTFTYPLLTLDMLKDHTRLQSTYTQFSTTHNTDMEGELLRMKTFLIEYLTHHRGETKLYIEVLSIDNITYLQQWASRNTFHFLHPLLIETLDV